MNIKEFLPKWFGCWRKAPELSEPLLIQLLRMLEKTREDELSCDDVFALVDEYVEAVQRGEDVARLKPLVLQHLEMCRECEEEYQALLRVLEGVSS